MLSVVQGADAFVIVASERGRLRKRLDPRTPVRQDRWRRIAPQAIRVGSSALTRLAPAQGGAAAARDRLLARAG